MRNKEKIIGLSAIILFSAISYSSAIDFSSLNNISVKNILPKKKKKDLETKSLFLQSRFQRIELPPADTLSPSNGQHIVVEQVSYEHADNTLSGKANAPVAKGKITEVQNLNEVVVTAKSRFTPEHNGKIDVDFVVKVPKDLLSSRYRLILMPKLLHNDSLVNLETIVVRGTEFKAAQIEDSLKYDAYLNSIVDPSKYDSLFLDGESVRKDIKKYQTVVYDKYTDDWNQHKDFVEKSQSYRDKETKLDTKYRTYASKKNAEFGKKVFDEKFKRILNNRDTLGIYNGAVLQYNKKMNKENLEYEKKNNKLLDKQMAYRTTDFPLQDTPNSNFTYQDSVNLSKYYYDFGKITENEIKSEQRADVYKRMTRFGEIENVRLDTVMTSNGDFEYYYKQTYPVTPRLKKVSIFMDAKVEAVDQSGYFSPAVDTLSYFIASMAQLADASLLYKTSNLNKIAYNKVTAFLKYPAGKNSVLNINYSDNRSQMLGAEAFLDAVKRNKVYAVDSVVVEVTRSLNGKYEDNANIAIAQANAVKKYLAGRYRDTNFADRFFADPKGEDWNTLVSEIRSNEKITNKDGILNMLANAKIPDDCKKEIQRKYKSDYAVMESDIFPYMDKTDIVFYVRRTDMTEDKETRREYRGDNYAKGLKLLQDREYWQALQLLADYGDYNTALCLTCLGYNGKAYDLLGQLPKTAETCYLKAIVANRLGQKTEAVESLKESIKMDPSKRYRIGLDAEAKNIASGNSLD